MHRCRRNLRRGSTSVPLLAAVAAVVVVVATLQLICSAAPPQVLLSQPAATSSPPGVTSASFAEPRMRTRTVSSERVLDENDFVSSNSPKATSTTNRTAVAASIPNDEPSSAATDSAGDSSAVADRIRQHIASGEFAPALASARGIEDPIARRQQLLIIAEAQIAAGEFDGALLAIRTAENAAQAIEEASTLPNRANGDSQSLAGGAFNADPTELIQLIQQETAGPWQDIDGTGGTLSYFSSGVRVEPNGLLRQLTRTETQGHLNELAGRMHQAELHEDMSRRATLRLVSLRRLETMVRDRVSQGLPPLETMSNLAGLTAVSYLFVDHNENDILIGGPAEGWQYNEEGQPLGATSQRPTLQLDDLVTVLRTFSADGMNAFECSIDPRPENVQRVTEYVNRSNARGSLRPNQVSPWVRTLQRLLGMQEIRVDGVPRDSRVSRVIVEADYRMKLIGIGKLAGVAGIESFFDLLSESDQKNTTDMDALRWWLTMKYDAVVHSANRDVFELQGSSVLCRSENEMIEADGRRVATGKADETNRLFARKFTEHYAELAATDPVFADLQNVFDLSLVAALIRQQGLDQAVDWDRGVFAAHGLYQTRQYEAPTEVMTVADHRVYNGRNIVVQVAGGVNADLMSVINDPQTLRTSETLPYQVSVAQPAGVPANRWWWDVKR